MGIHFVHALVFALITTLSPALYAQTTWGWLAQPTVSQARGSWKAIKGLKKRIRKLQRRINQIRRQRDRTIKNLRKDNSALRSQVNALNTQIASLNTTIANLNTQIDSLNTENTDLNAQIADLQTQIANLNIEIDNLVDINIGLQSQVTDLQQQLTDLQNQTLLSDQVNCLIDGTKIVSGLDANNNNILEEVEIQNEFPLADCLDPTNPSPDLITEVFDFTSVAEVKTTFGNIIVEPLNPITSFFADVRANDGGVLNLNTHNEKLQVRNETTHYNKVTVTIEYGFINTYAPFPNTAGIDFNFPSDFGSDEELTFPLDLAPGTTAELPLLSGRDEPPSIVPNLQVIKRITVIASKE